MMEAKRTELRRALNGPTIAAASVLLAGLLGLHGASWALGWNLRKAEQPLERPLYLFPEELGPFEKVGEQTLSHALVDELGTKRYLTRTYRDSEAEPGARADAVQLHMAYYSGWADATPHVPTRLFVLDGKAGRPLGRRQLSLRPERSGEEDRADAAAGADGEREEPAAAPGETVTVRLMRVKGARRARGLVGVLHIVNGRYTAEAEEVQRRVSDLRRRRAYWMTIELMPGMYRRERFRRIDDPDRATRLLERFAAHALPAVWAVLPEMEAEAQPE